MAEITWPVGVVGGHSGFELGMVRPWRYGFFTARVRGSGSEGGRADQHTHTHVNTDTEMG